jgi:translation initiation factor 1A
MGNVFKHDLKQWCSVLAIVPVLVVVSAMPKNKGKGGKNRRKGKTDGSTAVKRELLFKEDGQEYAKVVKLLGNCNLSLECADEVQRIGHIRGSMRKKVWVKLHDVCLISLRDFQDNKADIIHVYDADEVRMLCSYGELSKQWDGMGDSGFLEEQDDVTFEIDDI